MADEATGLYVAPSRCERCRERALTHLTFVSGGSEKHTRLFTTSRLWLLQWTEGMQLGKVQLRRHTKRVVGERGQGVGRGVILAWLINSMLKAD